MNLIINGKSEDHQAATVSELLARLQLDPMRVAVEINHQIVAREDFNATLLEENDKLEIVQFVGGG